MKSFIVLCLLVFATSSSIPTAEIKEFYGALLAGAGYPATIKEECLGTKFEENLVALFKYADQENHLLIILTAQTIALDIYNNCPKDETMKIVKTIQKKIEDKTLYDNIITKAMNVSKIFVAEYKATTHTPTSVGKAIGECIAVFISNASNELDLEISNDLFNDIVEGFLDGLTKEGGEGLCKADVLKNRQEIVNIVKEIIAALKEGKDITEVIGQAITKLLGMADLLTDCRLFNLVGVINKLMTQKGLDDLVKRVTDNLSKILIQAQSIITSVLGKDFAGAGKAIGTIARLVLDFYVN